jgi:hypothetical protein
MRANFPSKQNKRIFVVNIHVLHDPASTVSQRVGLRVSYSESETQPITAKPPT